MQVKLTSVMSNVKFYVQCKVLSCFAGVFTVTIGFLGDRHSLVRLHEVPPPAKEWLVKPPGGPAAPPTPPKPPWPAGGDSF